MMNRGVMQRQMFAKGGAAFPDLSGDGNVTRKDILMGRGVPMQMGGEPQMALGDYLGGQTDELAAEAARLGISKEQLLELLNQQAMQAQADAMGISLRELLAIMISPPFAPSGNMAGPEATMLRPNETYSEPTSMSSSIQRNPDMANYIDESGELFYDPASGAGNRKQMFDEAAAIAAKNQQPVGMAMGGDPAMAQGVGSMMPPPPAMPPAQGPIGNEEVMDPQVLQGMLNEASQSVGDLENAEDYETVINSIRGDDAPISARYEELASVVGEEDAAQTPESVLALTQPAIMMGAVDQGIGGLAQEEMSQPVEGAMAQGIMSTVAPPPPAAPMPPAGMGGPPPVNFNQGGLVRRGDNQPVQMYANGGEATPLQTAYEGRLPLYKSIVGDPTAQLEEQQKLTKANMLFDIANTALAFAAPMQGETPGMSAAERLAMAAQKTQLLPTIGARAQQQLDAKKAATAAEQKMKLGALGAAEADVTAQAKAKAEAALAKQKAKAVAVENALDRAADVSKILLQGTVDMEMAETKENWRSAAADAQRLAEKDAAKLLASNNLKAIERGKELQKQIDVSKMLLQSELTLDRLGVEDAYKLNQQKIGHDYAMTLQEANLKVTRARDANNKALKLADQEIEEAKMLQTSERDAAVARINQRKQALEEEKLELDKAARGLETFGKTGKNKAQSILANPKLLEGYAKDTLDETQTTQVSNAIDLLSTRETIVQDGQAVKTGGSIPEAARQAVIARSKLPATEGQTRLMPRDLKRITAVPKQFGEAVSKIMANVPDASIAFGSDAVARNVVNTATEAFTFGLAKAPFESTEKAISAVKQLNLDTVTHFQDIKELRDSVALLNMLKDQTANPNAFLTGDTRAKNKTQTVMDTIDELISVLDLKIENMTDVEDLNEARLGKQKALQLRAGFEAIDRAYAKIGSGGTAITSEIEAEQENILKNIIGKKKEGAK